VPTGPRPRQPDDTTRISIEGHFIPNAHAWACVFHTYVPGQTADVASWQTYVDAVSNLFETAFAPAISRDVKVTLARGTLFQSPTDSLTVERGRSAIGGAGDDMMPAQCCACVSWLATPSYRGGHPRTYLPGPYKSAELNPGTFTGTFTNYASTGAADFLAGVNALSTADIATSILGEIHFQKNDVWLTPPTFSPFLSHLVRPFIRTQRRRIEP
jgi:hypothetical protein